MATLTSGAHGRTNQSGTSERTVATVQDSAKFSRIVTFTGNTNGSVKQLHLTGSNDNSAGFIVESAGNTVITPTEGDAIAASALTAKTLYEIGVRVVSGSGTIHVVF
jgi:energy-converting hydrogenase Eha subunit B|tara:strand:- start:561 stop:881 length:321 start_codon:yes stop_codon:yes gene_type:complete